jgi:hypothetical protein
LVLAIAGPALVACTARIALKDYPRSRIDRPYTLPAGVDTWTTAATGSYVRDNYGSNTLVPVPWPLNWGLSLSDTWTLELNPVPLAISHELLRTDDHLLGARLSWSLGFGSEGVLLAPSLRMDHRIRLGRTWAWGTAVSGGITRWTNQPSWGWSVGLGTGPIWQVTDTVALQPVVGLGVARTHLLLPGFPLTHVAQVVAPLGMNATFSVARQWDFDASFSYDRIGRENGYAAYSGSVALTHFW